MTCGLNLLCLVQAISEWAKSRTLQEQRRFLPVYDCRDELLQVIRENQVVVVVGETGSGKTTQVCIVVSGCVCMLHDAAQGLCLLLPALTVDFVNMSMRTQCGRIVEAPLLGLVAFSMSALIYMMLSQRDTHCLSICRLTGRGPGCTKLCIQIAILLLMASRV